ncbi:hypothetical protein AX17_000992 [Amanita inopinata Kibby_2008]|nr:hypothetical protein AX17_000992 [Amanita inopinata Kibby_2008]
MSPLRRSLMKNWFAVEAIPIYVIIGGVLTGATWYLGRLALGPSIIWTKSNPTPWNTVKPEENTKMLAVNQKFDKQFVRLNVTSCLWLNPGFPAGRGTNCRDGGLPNRIQTVSRSVTYESGCDLIRFAFDFSFFVFLVFFQLVMSYIFDIGYHVPIPPEVAEDSPLPGKPLTILQGHLNLPCLVYGAAAFSNQYNSDDVLLSSTPLRTVRLALRYGIRAFDTSVYYGNSEIVLGNILKTLEPEFPRSTYQLMTKCGRYGQSDFDYTPSAIRETVKRSLQRLQTDYLDTVYLHDVEFVCTLVLPVRSGNHISALSEDAEKYGLAKGDEDKIRGEGDQKILDAIAELRKLQDEGLVRNIGITGYPLPTLLRLAILVLHRPPYKPLDVLLSYSHLSLQNSTFNEFAPHFLQRAHVRQLVAASPLSMGLLTSSPPAWHPAPPELRKVVENARIRCARSLPSLALGFSVRNTGSSHHNMPLVIGLSTPHEVHECVKAWREIQEEEDVAERRRGEECVVSVLRDAGYKDWSWSSP